MEFEKNIIGKSSQWILISVDREKDMFSVASKDGSISILSSDETLLYEWKIHNIKLLSFIQERGVLVGISNQFDLHVWYVNSDYPFFDYKYYGPQSNIGTTVSCFNFCESLSKNNSSKNANYILIGSESGEFQWILIANDQIIISNIISTMDYFESKQRIDQILEVAFECGKFLGLLLINQELYRFTCNIEWAFSENSNVTAIRIENTIFSPFCGNVKDVTHVKLVGDNRIILCTHSGKYGIFNYCDDDMVEIIGNYIFPYGPFPCNPIKKCLIFQNNEIKGKCCIFSGGMPAVTYRHLNTLSVSINDEPEICFTFDDPVVDFTTIPNSLYGSDKILVLTVTELVSISYNNGKWISNSNRQLRPFTKNEITGISNIIEMTNGMNLTFQNIFNEYAEDTTLIRIFAVSSNDNSISIWLLNSNQYSLYERIDLNSFYNTNINMEKNVLWPRFQKCGIWRHQPKELVNINMMKLIKNSDESIYLIISTNRNSVLLFKIYLQDEREIDENIQSKTWTHHHVSVNDEFIKYKEVNYETYCPSNGVDLISLVTFSDQIEAFIINFHIESNMINFAGNDCVGCINVISGKYLFVPLEVLVQIENSKPGNHLLELFKKKLKKEKRTETSFMEKKICDLCKIPNSKTTASKPMSMFLWENYPKSFNLILGLNSGSVILIYFHVDENGNFNLENQFKKLNTNTSLAIIDIQILEIDHTSLSKTYEPPMNKREFEYSESIDQALGSSLDSSISTDKRSIGATYTNSSYNDEASMKSFKTNTASLQWFQNRSKLLKKETLLIRCDPESVKVIDNFKMKTRFKFKLNEYLIKNSLSTFQKKESIEKSYFPKIMESRICSNDHVIDKHTYQLFLSNHLMLELHLPTLCPLRTINFLDSKSDLKLISMTQEIVVIAENFNSSAQLKVLSTQKYKIYNLIEKVQLSNQMETSTSTNTKTEETQQIDFMKEARSSLNSLI